MLRALSTAASGMDAQQTKLDVTANNIANVGTSGFKKTEVRFEDLLYQTNASAGAATSSLSRRPTATQVGLGVRVGGTARLQTQGDMKVTGNPLDIAIEGDGFFPIAMPNGGTAYTRAGNFDIDQEGRIVTSSGHALMGDINIPSDAEQINISQDGLITVKVSTQAELMEVGKIQVVTFTNPAGLEAMGHNLLRESQSSGVPVVVQPGEAGTGGLTQGSLEMSNVKVVEEMIDLISGQRAYEVNSRVVRAADEMLQQAANLR